MEPRFFDAHCHLDLMLSPDAAASESAALGLGLFDCGVNPRDFSAANERARRQPGIIAGIGLHPWWLADGRCGAAEVNLLCELASRERFIGEDSIFHHALRAPRESRRRHLSGFAKLYRSTHSLGASCPFTPFAQRGQPWTFWSRAAF
mgnify:CR=1 FL=1